MTKRTFAGRLRIPAVALSFVFAAACVFARDRGAATRAATVVIDAGHGGFDRGGIPGQRVPEKTITLDVAQRLRKKLQGAGYRVVMTRDSDVFVPLGTRVAIANAHRGAIFICIHFNSATRLGANGIETYYYRRDSMSLAADIHRNLIAGAASENRGIRRRGYYVLRKTAIPGVLVECGFLTNPTEARLALTTAYRDKLADEIARGVVGKPALVARDPASWHYPPAPAQLQPFNRFIGTDFIMAEPERSRKRSKSSKSKKSSRHKTTKKKTTSKKSSTSGDEESSTKKPED